MNQKMSSGFNPKIGGRTALMRAAFDGNLDKSAALLQEGADVNARDADDDTALMFASLNGHFPVVKLLLGHGADVLLRARNGWTAKQAAQSKGHKEVVALLERAEEKAVAAAAGLHQVDAGLSEKGEA